MNLVYRKAAFLLSVYCLAAAPVQAQDDKLFELDSSITIEMRGPGSPWEEGDFHLRMILAPFNVSPNATIDHPFYGNVTLVQQFVGPKGVQLVFKKGRRQWTETYPDLRWDLLTSAKAEPDQNLRKDKWHPALLTFIGNTVERVEEGYRSSPAKDSTSYVRIYFSPAELPEEERTNSLSRLKKWAIQENDLGYISKSGVQVRFTKNSTPQVVLFWYNGCGPCLTSMKKLWPFYQQLHRKVDFSFVSLMPTDTSLMNRWPRTRMSIREILLEDKLYYTDSDFYFMEEEWDQAFLKTLSPDWDGSFVPMIFLIKNKKVVPVKPGDDLEEKMKSLFATELSTGKK